MNIFSYPLVWPSISEELAPFSQYFQGIILNAGSGSRSIQLGKKDLRIDIEPGNDPDIVADLHRIPLLDESVDTIVSIAVLEHTRYAWIVAEEFYRVLRSGGYGVIAVPFLQPQHACPYDFVRFTRNGLSELMEYVGFEIVETRSVHHFGQTLAWLLWEYLQVHTPKKITWPFWYTLLRQLSKGRILGKNSPNTNNTEYVIVRKPGGTRESESAHYREALQRLDSPEWFFPLLACPRGRLPLYRQGDRFISADNQFTYGYREGKLYILPSDGEFRVRLNPTDKLAPVSDNPAPTTYPAPTPDPVVPAPLDSSADVAIPLLEGNYEVTFRPDFARLLSRSTGERVAILATTEYEGIFKNGGIGTYYKNLAKRFAGQGWKVILLLCDFEKNSIDLVQHPEISHIFLTSEIQQFLDLQMNHRSLLSHVQKNWYNYQSYCCLFFIQAILEKFQNSKVYVEFHEMSGIGYQTIQAKRTRCLGDNCQVGVTMHSGHEWVYEANEKYYHDRQNIESLWEVCSYEQFSFEEADLAFFPSRFLHSKISQYGWCADNSIHMPNYVPII